MGAIYVFVFFQGIAAVLVYLAVKFVETWGNYSRLAADTYAIVPAGIILGIAVILLVASIVGCCGTCSDNRCCLGVVRRLKALDVQWNLTHRKPFS